MHKLCSRLLFAALLPAGFGVAGSGWAQGSPSPIDVADLVRFGTIGDGQMLTWQGRALASEIGVFSPDGRYVAVVIHQGDPVRETNDGSILVYRMAELMGDAEPKTVARFSSATAFQPVAMLKWAEDSRTLYFAATDGGAVSQVYEVDVSKAIVHQLTSLTAQLLSYAVIDDGRRILTVTEQTPAKPEERLACREQGCLVTEQILENAERGGSSAASITSVHIAGERGNRILVAPESIDPDLSRCDPHLGASPSGRFVIRQCRIKGGKIPHWWSEYVAFPRLPDCIRRQNWHCVRRGFLTDTVSGKTFPLSDSPLLPYPLPAYVTPEPIWIDDGERAILPAALESLSGTQGAERRARAEQYSVILLDPKTRALNRIARLPAGIAVVTSATWDQGSETLSLTADTKEGEHLQLAFARRDQGWLAVPSKRPIAPSRVSLSVQQSLNERPLLVATAPTGERKILFDPNPWLAQRKLGRVERIEWRLDDGRTWRGGLYYPPEYRAGQKYPLLIQTHGFSDDEFSLSGFSWNFPGQAIAAHGIIVLQVAEDTKGVARTPAEWPTVQQGYERAIDHLDKLGLILRDRIGIIGWSWTGSTSAYTLTHSEYPFAAAALTDSGIHGLGLYMSEGAPSTYDVMYGAPPFGEGLKNWMEFSPVFNINRLRTPYLMWQARWVGYLWDWNIGLRRAGVPVEYWFLPTGTHNAYDASQRQHTNQLLVDWFRFWLKDEEDSDPAKSDQYSRWREFRQQQRQLLLIPRPPLLDWTSSPKTDVYNKPSAER